MLLAASVAVSVYGAESNPASLGIVITTVNEPLTLVVTVGAVKVPGVAPVKVIATALFAA
jgi:hypothetical protein